MNNKDFLAEVASIAKIQEEEAQACCDAMQQTLETMLTNGDEVCIRGFGRFGVVKTYEHIVEKEGKRMLVPPQLMVEYVADGSTEDKENGEHTASQPFLNLLAQRLACSDEDAEILTFAFFKAIVNGLGKDKTVKVKNLGQFKVNASKTKEKEGKSSQLFLSEALGSVSFLPDNVLKAAVNKPFEHFQPVVLNDGVDFDDLKSGEIKTERISGEPLSAQRQQQKKVETDGQDETKVVASVQPTEDRASVAGTSTEEKPAGENNALPEVEGSKEEAAVAEMSVRHSSKNWKWLVVLCGVAAIIALVVLLLPRHESADQTASAVATVAPADTMAVVTPTEEEDFTEANDRVRYGAYKIVGVDTAIIMQQGQTPLSISAAYFGGIEMEPYIKAVNGGKNDFVAGDYVKIPKLEIKE